MPQNLTDQQIKDVRMALSGQTEEPVTLETDPSEDASTEDPPDQLLVEQDAPRRCSSEEQPQGGSLLVSPDEIVQELSAHDPILLELLASRAALKRLTGHAAHQG